MHPIMQWVDGYTAARVSESRSSQNACGVLQRLRRRSEDSGMASLIVDGADLVVKMSRVSAALSIPHADAVCGDSARVIRHHARRELFHALPALARPSADEVTGSRLLHRFDIRADDSVGL